jgi:hypothetical protein
MKFATWIDTLAEEKGYGERVSEQPLAPGEMSDRDLLDYWDARNEFLDA